MKQRAGSVLRLAKPLKAWAQRFAFLSLVGAAFALMLLAKADTVLIERARLAVVDAVSPILDAVARPVGTVRDLIGDAKELASLREENQELRARIDRLMRWQAVAQRLESENQALRGSLQLVPDPFQTFVSARVIADQGGAFVRSVLVNAGARDGVDRGQAALTGEGLAGRVAEVGRRSARVLLITDMNSRIPVTVGKARERAVLAGNNTDRPRLLYLGPRVKVEPGDRVATSGHGGVLPPGLPIGNVVALDETGVMVQPYMDQAHMEFLRLVNFEMPGLLLPNEAEEEAAIAEPEPKR